MGLPETAQLLVKLTVEDGGTAAKAKLSIGDLGKTALAVGGAAGFAALTKGALDAEAAQGKFMAATGSSREEAKKFVTDMDGLAGTAGAVGHSFEEIAATGTMVQQQFGTTGQKTRDLTDDILKFSKVTGQDAAGAAGDLEDTLSAFGLSADDAAGFMDKLVASNQKYGTEVGPEALSTLRQFAPALQAMGMDLDDGVGLLNAFEVAGLDAGTAQRGLNTALKSLPPGQNFDDVIAKLGAIEDPADRAKEAIKLFGTRAGPALALAIKPGMKSLDEFEVSASDAADATGKAADSMLTTGDRIQGFFDKLGAGARDVGQQFGPLVTGAGGLVTAMTPLKGKLGEVTQALKDQITQAGGLKAALGNRTSGLGGAMATLGPIAAGVAVGFIAEKVAADEMSKKVDEATASLKNMTPEQKAAGANAEFLGVKAGDALNTVGDFLGLLSPAFGDLKTNIHGMTDELNAVPFDDAGLAAHGLSERLDNVGVSAHTAAETVTTSFQYGVRWDAIKAQWIKDGQPIAETAGSKIADAAAGGLESGLRDNQSGLKSAWEDFVHPGEDFMSATAEIAWIKGKLTSKKLTDGLKSEDPLRRQWAEQEKTSLDAELSKLEGLLGQDGRQAGNSFTDNLEDTTPGAVAAAAALARRVNNAMEALRTNYKISVTTGNYGGEHGYSGGGRASGGPVASNRIYEVTEGGDPEMLRIGSRNFLLMGRDSGQVDPMRGPAGVSRASGGWSGQMPNVVVNVLITARDIDNAQSHRNVIQGVSGGFK